MNGAEALLRTLIDAGVEVCFTNPGTSEMHFVAALDQVPGMRCVLGLFEGVVTGAADGYSRIAGKPAATLLHLGPGLGNGLANLHNAKKGNAAIVNIVGDHATYHLQYDTPLTSDVVAVAKPMSHWVHSSSSSEHLPQDTAQAVAAAISAPGQIATLILPADISWGDSAPGPAAVLAPVKPRLAHADAIMRAAEALGCGEPAMILLGGHISDAELEVAARIAASCGARIAVETFASRLPWGAGRPSYEKIPYLAEFAIEHLKTVRRMVLVGANAPASFFAYPGVPSRLNHDDCVIVTLAEGFHDRQDALERLADALHADSANVPRNPDQPAAAPSGALSTATVGDAVAALLPQGAIIVDEGATCGMEVFPRCTSARPHQWITLTGGAIGWGLPAATGAAIAAPEAKVVCLEGDGSAMYTIQALWTMAREQLDVTVLLFANRDYAILQLEYLRVGATAMGANARGMMHIGNPDIDFVALAQSMGVTATRATNAEELVSQFGNAMAHPGPRLIEVMMPAMNLGW
ncbi:MAG: acetolactate synthase large subunit [Pseudomonadales bacterium]|nr:acetolactate synthase large subunit [Pseudomonadales bacterium]